MTCSCGQSNIHDEKEVIVSYCEYGTWWEYNGFLKDTRSRNADGAIACYKGVHPHIFILYLFIFCLLLTKVLPII